MHVDIVVAPTAAEYVPPGQFVQAAIPCDMPNLPAGQTLHVSVVCPVRPENLPTLHL
jgi:hypothetical protein